ncbi:MAG TPA: DUF6069 family protein [Acidimicrobiales bacterium]
MTATIVSTPTTVPPATRIRAALATWPVWAVGLVSTLVAAVAAMAVAAVAKAADVPLAVAASGETPETIPTSGFATVVVGAGLVGTLLAVALRRWSSRPARTFVAVTGALTVVSFLSPTPVMAPEATMATRLVLELTHVVAAAVIVPSLAYRLRRS